MLRYTSQTCGGCRCIQIRWIWSGLRGWGNMVVNLGTHWSGTWESEVKQVWGLKEKIDLVRYVEEGAIQLWLEVRTGWSGVWRVGERGHMLIRCVVSEVAEVIISLSACQLIFPVWSSAAWHPNSAFNNFYDNRLIIIPIQSRFNSLGLRFSLNKGMKFWNKIYTRQSSQSHPFSWPTR